MSATRLMDFLDRNAVHYITMRHSPAYTAQGIAASAHIPGREFAKTVIVLLDGRPAMAVLPAPRKVLIDGLRAATGAAEVKLATEHDFMDLFPDCELGAMPPFGNLYGMEVFVGQELAQDEHIVFNAGTHHELIRMAYADFERLVRPRVVKLAAAPV